MRSQLDQAYVLLPFNSTSKVYIARYLICFSRTIMFPCCIDHFVHKCKISIVRKTSMNNLISTSQRGYVFNNPIYLCCDNTIRIVMRNGNNSLD